jgi:hypothetical protein
VERSSSGAHNDGTPKTFLQSADGIFEEAHMDRRNFLAGMVATPTATKLTDLLSEMKTASGVKPAPTPTVPGKKNFVAWECMRWNNGPSSLVGCGLRTMPIYYQDALITGENPDYKKLDKVIAQIKAKKQTMVTLDVERWNAASDKERPKYMRLMDYMRERVPKGTKLSLYGIMPKPRYGDYVAGGSKFAYQQRENKKMRPLAAKCDWIMPMFHAYTTNRKDWATFAARMISEARTYDKPVMPWLWMQYHDLARPDSIRGQLIPGDFFRQQLDTAYRLADSLCLWGTLIVRPDGTRVRANWNHQSPWWNQTKAFLQTNLHNVNACKA